MQSDISGPHGIAFSPDRKNFYISIGHGRPYGTAVKYSTEDDRVEKQVGLGLFPATEDVTPDGNFLFVVNFNLHGDAVPSSVSVVDTNQMMEVARIPTCIMPHGSRITRDGAKQYSACMMDDLLVEIDTEKMKVSRTFRVSQGLERGYAGLPQKQDEGTEKMDHHDGAAMNMSGITCSPTWARRQSYAGLILLHFHAREPSVPYPLPKDRRRGERLIIALLAALASPLNERRAECAKFHVRVSGLLGFRCEKIREESFSSSFERPHGARAAAPYGESSRRGPTGSNPVFKGTPNCIAFARIEPPAATRHTPIEPPRTAMS